MRGDWTADDFDKLAELAAQGLSASAIGEHIGRTRNAVIGYARRHFIALTFKKSLKLGEGAARRRIRQALYARIMRAKQRESAGPKIYKPRAAPTLQLPPPRPKPVQVTAFKPVLFLSRRMSDGLGNGQCCAIINDGVPIEKLLVCGGAIPVESAYEFCEAHQSRFLQPLRRLTAA